MNKQPKITLYIPTYNRDMLLQKALESALAQTYKNLEIFISDNASTDKTEKMCRGYAKRYPQIKYHRHEENIGMFANGQFIFDSIETEYCVGLCDDDWISANYVEELVKALNVYPESSMVFGVTHLYDNERKLLLKALPTAFLQQSYQDRIASYFDLVSKRFLINALYRTSVAREAFYIGKIRLWEDRLFFAKMLMSSIAPCASTAIYHKWNHDNALTGTNENTMETFEIEGLTDTNSMTKFADGLVESILRDEFYRKRLDLDQRIELVKAVGEPTINRNINLLIEKFFNKIKAENGESEESRAIIKKNEKFIKELEDIKKHNIVELINFMRHYGNMPQL